MRELKTGSYRLRERGKGRETKTEREREREREVNRVRFELFLTVYSIR